MKDNLARAMAFALLAEAFSRRGALLLAWASIAMYAYYVLEEAGLWAWLRHYTDTSHRVEQAAALEASWARVMDDGRVM